MAEKLARRALWASPRLHASCAAIGLAVGGVLLGASCPHWPVPLQPVCVEASRELKVIGLGFLGLSSQATRSDRVDGGG